MTFHAPGVNALIAWHQVTEDVCTLARSEICQVQLERRFRFPKPQVIGSIPTGGASHMKSSAHLTRSHLVIEPRGWARMLAPYSRDVTVPRDSVAEEVHMTAEDVG